MTGEAARATTLRKFNPGALQTDQEIVRQFVVRGQQLDTILEVLRENLDADSNQHLLVVAPRGRGKTMLLARVAAELRRAPALAARLLPVRFMEESMEVLGIADFWLECLLHLANALAREHPEKAEVVRQTRAQLAEIMDDKILEQRARAAVLDAADELDRRLVLMVENLQDLASDAGEDFGWQLRKVLQNEPRIIVIATATSRFATLDKAEQPFFETFREIALPPLDCDECRRLWGAVTGDAIGARETRPLQILTGGSPRLLIFIAGFSRHHSMRQLMEELVTLIDDHTEYFRGHLDALAPKERRVYLALIDLWQPSTAREVAQRARIEIRATSSLLGRLVSRGAVTVDQNGAKHKHYAAVERLYSIYYKLRRERNEAAVVQGLVRFMAAFYTGADLQSAVASLIKECRDAPAIRHGLRLAMTTDDDAPATLIGVMSFDDFESALGGKGQAVQWVQARLLLAFKAMNQFEYPSVLQYVKEILDRFRGVDDPVIRLSLAIGCGLRAAVFETQGQFENAVSNCEDAFSLLRETNGPQQIKMVAHVLAHLLNTRGRLLRALDRREGALASFREVVDRFGDTELDGVQVEVANAYVNCGLVQGDLGKLEEEFSTYSEALERFAEMRKESLDGPISQALLNRGLALLRMGRREDAVANFEQILIRFGESREVALREVVAQALSKCGSVFLEEGRVDDAVSSFSDIVDRFAGENTGVLQRSVVEGILGVQWAAGFDVARGLYRKWYHQFPGKDALVLRVFQLGTLGLAVFPVPAKLLLEILESEAEKSQQLDPLIVALRLENGEDVRAPTEILEVADDVRKQLAELRESYADYAGSSGTNEKEGV